QASSTYLRRLASAFGAGSVAITSNPRAKYCAAQLAPMTPVPTIAIRRMGLLYDMLTVSPFKLILFIQFRSGDILTPLPSSFARSQCRNLFLSSSQSGPSVRDFVHRELF